MGERQNLFRGHNERGGDVMIQRGGEGERRNYFRDVSSVAAGSPGPHEL